MRQAGCFILHTRGQGESAGRCPLPTPCGLSARAKHGGGMAWAPFVRERPGPKACPEGRHQALSSPLSASPVSLHLDTFPAHGYLGLYFYSRSLQPRDPECVLPTFALGRKLGKRCELSCSGNFTTGWILSSNPFNRNTFSFFLTRSTKYLRRATYQQNKLAAEIG